MMASYQTLLLSKAFLKDAESKELDDVVKPWLEQLKDRAYEADNVLDELIMTKHGRNRPFFVLVT